MGHLKYLLLLFVVIACHSGSTKNDEILLKGGNINLFGNDSLNIKIPDLYIQHHEVTNAEFAEFVKSTGYITTAEKKGNGMILNLKTGNWELLVGANWKHPQGKSSTINQKMNHPVVQVSYEDACSYCNWKGMRLPYESEWEFIAEKDGTTGAFNHWQGIFPVEDKGEDGFKGISPVGSFESGKTGCVDIRGNVWEWCNDYYHELWPDQAIDFSDLERYKGPPTSYSGTNMYDTLRVIKGGSFLCADNYCRGYALHNRMHADPQLSYEHVGFRCVRLK